MSEKEPAIREVISEGILKRGGLNSTVKDSSRPPPPSPTKVPETSGKDK